MQRGSPFRQARNIIDQLKNQKVYDCTDTDILDDFRSASSPQSNANTQKDQGRGPVGFEHWRSASSTMLR